MKLLIASNNRHKFQEISPSFDMIGIECLMPSQLQLALPEEIECHPTYQENAKAKVRYFLSAPTDGILGDDSGLEVHVLQDKPGIHSARFAGTGREEDNRHYLLEMLKNVPFPDRKARFICVLCLYWLGKFYFFEGTVDGIILEKETGDKGFGYDSLFYIPSLDKTFAEMTQQEKLKLSHRGKALEKCIAYLRNQSIPKVGVEPTRGCPH